VKAEDIIRALAAEDIEEREFGKFGGPPTVCRRCCHILPGPHATICLWAAAKQWVEAADREPKLLFCGVRDGGDFWHLECRFDDGQKFAAIQVDKDHEKLADEIAAYLNTRKEKEQALGLAEIRIRQLGEQLAACEKALAERDARVIGLSRDAGRLADEVDALIRSKVIDSRSPAADALLDFREPPRTPRSDRLADLDKIVWGLVHNAGRCITSGRVERWAAVMEAVGCGSTQAHELCRRHGLDSDELVGRGDLCGGCEEDGGTCGGCICDDAVSQHCTRSDEDLGGHGCECERRRVAQLEAELQELSAVRDQLEACPFCAVPRCAARCQLLG
jgi:hypothetical protein